MGEKDNILQILTKNCTHVHTHTYTHTHTHTHTHNVHRTPRVSRAVHSCQKNKEHKTQCIDYLVVVQSLCPALLRLHGLSGFSGTGFPGNDTGVGCHFLLQGISPSPGLNPCHQHWQADSLPGKNWFIGHHNKQHRLGGLNNGNVFPHSFGG